MWAITLSNEVSTYLYGSYPYVEDVMEALESLTNTEQGIPPEGCTQIEPGIYLWEVADHLVIYMRILDERPRLRILVVKPRE